MSNWKNPPYHNSKEYDDLCKNSKPSDFYFSVIYNYENDIYIVITPKAYFDKNGYSWDQSMNIDHLLPNGCQESMECVYEILNEDYSSKKVSIKEIEKEMLEKGFLKNKDFDQEVIDNYKD